jgi:hypothetical protein
VHLTGFVELKQRFGSVVAVQYFGKQDLDLDLVEQNKELH